MELEIKDTTDAPKCAIDLDICLELYEDGTHDSMVNVMTLIFL